MKAGSLLSRLGEKVVIRHFPQDESDNLPGHYGYFQTFPCSSLHNLTCVAVDLSMATSVMTLFFLSSESVDYQSDTLSHSVSNSEFNLGVNNVPLNSHSHQYLKMIEDQRILTVGLIRCFHSPHELYNFHAFRRHGEIQLPSNGRRRVFAY